MCVHIRVRTSISACLPTYLGICACAGVLASVRKFVRSNACVRHYKALLSVCLQKCSRLHQTVHKIGIHKHRLHLARRGEEN